MGGHSSRSCSSPETLPPEEPAYIVEHADEGLYNGNYYTFGIFNAEFVYKNTSNMYLFFDSEENNWILGQGIGVANFPYYVAIIDDLITGDYSLNGDEQEPFAKVSEK